MDIEETWDKLQDWWTLPSCGIYRHCQIAGQTDIVELIHALGHLKGHYRTLKGTLKGTLKDTKSFLVVKTLLKKKNCFFSKSF